MVATHSFLGDNDLFTSVDYEVATLIVATVLAIFNSLVFVEILELAEVRPKHHWDFSKVNSLFFLFKDDIFNLSFSLASLRTVVEVVFEFFLAELNIGVDLGAVGQISHSSLVRENRHHAIVRLDHSRTSVDMNLRELHFINHRLRSIRLLFACGVLRYLFDLDFSVLRDDVLDTELEEAVEALNLLGHKPMLLEVGLDDYPSVVSVDGSSKVFG